jgi:hypothetical protein
MRLRNVTSSQVLGSPTDAINRYPGCRDINNSGQTGTPCSFGSGALSAPIFTSDLGNMFCEATNSYVIDPQNSQYNPKSISGFEEWKYIKNLGSDGDPDAARICKLLQPISPISAPFYLIYKPNS